MCRGLSNCARARFSLAAPAFLGDRCRVRYAVLTCEKIHRTGIGYTFEPVAQAITGYDREFD
jgi:hypothetical protein